MKRTRRALGVIGITLIACIGGISVIGKDTLRLHWALWAVKWNSESIVIPAIEYLGRVRCREGLADIIDAWYRLEGKAWWNEGCELVAIDAVGNVGSDAVPVIMQMLEHEQRERRLKGIACLYVMAGREDMDWRVLTPVLQDKDAIVRASALWCVEKLGELAHDAVDMVIPMLRDKEVFVRHAALAAYGSIAGVKFRRNIVEESARDSEESVRRLALEILGKYGAKD